MEEKDSKVTLSPQDKDSNKIKKEIEERVKEKMRIDKERMKNNNSSFSGEKNKPQSIDEILRLNKENEAERKMILENSRKQPGYLKNSSNGRKISSSSVSNLLENRKKTKDIEKDRKIKNEEVSKKTSTEKKEKKDNAKIAKDKQDRVRKLTSALKNKISRKRNRSDLNAMSAIIIITVFIVSIVADLIDIILDLTGVGDFLAPLTSALTGAIVGFLWWSIGAGDFNNKLKKNGKRMGWTMLIEAIPAINAIPTFTITSILNLLDYLGFFEKNRVTKELKRALS